MQFDLMLNPGRFAWAVNVMVEEEEGTVRIGALYLEPNVPDPNIRLTHGSDIFDVVLPEEFVRRGENLRAWNVELPLLKHE